MQLMPHIDEINWYEIYRIDNLSIHDIYLKKSCWKYEDKNADLGLDLCYPIQQLHLLGEFKGFPMTMALISSDEV